MREQGEEKLYIQVFRKIRTYIIENKLKPGDYLPTELELYTRFGVSRNVLREAIKSMELMGMLESCAGRGTIVKDFNLDFIFQNVLFFTAGDEESKAIRDMFSIRRTLELAYLPQIFMGITDEEIRHLKECANGIAERWNQREFFWEIDRDFHMTLMKPLHNEVLNSLLLSIWGAEKSFETEKKFPHLDHTIMKHAAIVDALEAHDYDLFVRAMQNHYSSGKYLSKENYEEY